MELLPVSLPCLELRGEGVFAGHDIKKGELVERSPVIPVPADQWILVSQTVLRHYAYAWGEEGKDSAIALGWGSLLRGLEQNPTTCCVVRLAEMIIEFFAVKDITPGEEITVSRRRPGLPPDYGPGPLQGAGAAGETEALFYVRQSPGKGRGVFALRPIAGGQMIERAPLLIIPAGEWNQIEKTVLSNYWFSFGPNKEHAAIALGYGSLYNHSYSPNAVYEIKDLEAVAHFKALQEIGVGEEITINYNRDPRDRSPVWFDVI